MEMDWTSSENCFSPFYHPYCHHWIEIYEIAFEKKRKLFFFKLWLTPKITILISDFCQDLFYIVTHFNHHHKSQLIQLLKKLKIKNFLFLKKKMISITSTGLGTRENFFKIQNNGYRTRLKLKKPIKNCSNLMGKHFSEEEKKKLTRIEIRIFWKIKKISSL